MSGVFTALLVASLAAVCGLAVWKLWPGRIPAVSVTVKPTPNVPGEIAFTRQKPGANGYGAITGQIVFEGKIPERDALVLCQSQKFGLA